MPTADPRDCSESLATSPSANMLRQDCRKASAQLRELLGALPAAIYVTDAVGRITYCNESAINLWGARAQAGRG